MKHDQGKRASAAPPLLSYLLVALALSSTACAPMRPSADQPEAAVPLHNTIRWGTASESNNYGFDVYRGDSADGPFTRLTERPIEGGMESDVPRQYQFVDDTIAQGVTYYYYVEAISLDNVRERFTPIQASKPKYRDR